MPRLSLLVIMCGAALAQRFDRIVTPEEVANAVRPQSLAFARFLSSPHRKIASGMERGMVVFEQRKMREKFYQSVEELRRHGITLKFGGMGQGSGFGGGVVYEFRPAANHTLQTTALVTFKNYQELDLQWSSVVPASRFFLEASYQWRPRENYYGQGHDTPKAWHTSFALRQTWTGARYELYSGKRVRLGILNRWAWLTASEGRNDLLPAITSLFTYLPRYNSETRLNSTGVYVDLDGLRDEYQLGGAAHLGASYQRSFSGGNLHYLTFETQLEGRAPIKTRNSVLVGQANFQMNRERGSSDPIPFYLEPHIGGSTTLRGYALDRFYGRNLALLTLEYRIRVHPNIQFYPLFDEGQIFNQTSDLSWLNWHRTYGLGFRFVSSRGPFLRCEFGWGGEGTQIHIVFGDRDQPPVRGPIRYGAYKR